MNIILTALVAAAMGALVEFLPRPVRMGTTAEDVYDWWMEFEKYGRAEEL